MKKKFLVFYSIVFILIGYFIYSMFGTQCRNYRIEDISLRQVYLRDSSNVHYEKFNRYYYLLEFNIDYCNCEKVFMGGGVQQGWGGNIDTIQTISIKDSLGDDISALFRVLKVPPKSTMTKYKNNIDNSCQNFSFTELKKQIDSAERHESIKWIIYSDSNDNLPKKIKIAFSSYSIEKDVSNIKVNQ